MPDDPTKPDPPNSPASETAPPPSSEKTTDAGAASTTRRSPLIRELRPEEYGRDYVIVGTPERR
jgi:hypothetical protein